jgi:type II secretory pathway component GspD/PulD (secretin)
MRSRLLAAAAVLVALAASGRADDTAATKGRLVTKVFSVADLVTPIPPIVTVDTVLPATLSQLSSGPAACGGFRNVSPTPPLVTAPKLPTVAENAANLIKLITSTVRPTSWESSGGHGTIGFFDLGSALVVFQTAEVLKEVEDFLAALSRIQDMTIACEVRKMTASVAAIKVAGLKLPTKEGEVAFLTGKQFYDLMAAVQDDEDSMVVQAPKMTLRNGQTGTLRVMEQVPYLMSEDVRRVNGNTIIMPKTEMIYAGAELTLKGRIAADGKTIALGVNLTSSQVGGCPQVPVTIFVTPVFEGGSRGQPVPITQFIPSPAINKCGLEKQLVLPSGGHAVIVGPEEIYASEEETPIPVLSDLPLIGDLFTWTETRDVRVRTLVIISPVVITPDEATKSELTPMPVPVTRPVGQTPDLAAPVTQAVPCSPRIVAPPPVTVSQTVVAVKLAGQHIGERLDRLGELPSPGETCVVPPPPMPVFQRVVQLAGQPNGMVVPLPPVFTGPAMLPCERAQVGNTAPVPVPCETHANQCPVAVMGAFLGPQAVAYRPAYRLARLMEVVVPPVQSDPMQTLTLAIATPQVAVDSCDYKIILYSNNHDIYSGIPQVPVDASAICKLRNVAAADVVHTLTEFLGQDRQGVTLVAEPVSNTVLVQADLNRLHPLMKIVHELDQAPEQVEVRAMIVQVPTGFTQKIGVATGPNEGGWLLTDRETRMLNAAILAEPKGEILSRPTLRVANNQTGFTQVGQNYNGQMLGETIRVTPRILPDNSVLLRTEIQHSEVCPTLVDLGNGQGRPAFNCTSVETTHTMSLGSTMVYQQIGKNGHDILVILTVNRPESSPAEAAPSLAPVVSTPSPR